MDENYTTSTNPEERGDDTPSPQSLSVGTVHTFKNDDWSATTALPTSDSGSNIVWKDGNMSVTSSDNSNLSATMSTVAGSYCNIL